MADNATASDHAPSSLHKITAHGSQPHLTVAGDFLIEIIEQHHEVEQSLQQIVSLTLCVVVMIADIPWYIEWDFTASGGAKLLWPARQ